ncbi:hypothetical protein D3C71_1996350 [compost metagenome]
MSLRKAAFSVPTSAATTPSGARRRTHSTADAWRSTSATALMTCARCVRRAAMVAKRGSAIHSGRAISSQKIFQNLSCVMNKVSQPSAVAKICAGTT